MEREVAKLPKNPVLNNTTLKVLNNLCFHLLWLTGMFFNIRINCMSKS